MPPAAARPGFSRIQLVVVLALIAFAVGLLIPIIERARASDGLAVCKDNLRQIGVALRHYADANAGALPVSPTVVNPHPDLVRLLTGPNGVPPKALYCPDEKDPARSFSDLNLRSGNIGYFYYSALGPGDDPDLSKFLQSGIPWPHELNASMSSQSWVMSDAWFSGKPTSHAGYRKGLNYLMLDGSVSFITGSPRQSFH